MTTGLRSDPVSTVGGEVRVVLSRGLLSRWVNRGRGITHEGPCNMEKGGGEREEEIAWKGVRESK
jgi:hypothetical protein